MSTCPNCRHQLEPGVSACPMCSTELSHPARGPSPLVPAIASVLGLALLALAVFAFVNNRRNAPASRVELAPMATGAAPSQPCPLPKERPTVPSKKTYAQPPTEKLDPAKRHVLTLDTTCGEITISLDVDVAPITTSSVAFLAKEGFFDGLVFHRSVPGFVIQGGDPLGNGTGGPGYTVTEAPPEGLKYGPGVVAMAKRGDEPPGASGSQFFIVSGPQASQLPPEYALVGRVAVGMDVVAKIEKSAAGSVVITKATVEQK